MATVRFPRASYVRKLELLYADLSQWRDRYMDTAHRHWDRQRANDYEERAIALEHVQHELLELIVALDSIKRLS